MVVVGCSVCVGGWGAGVVELLLVNRRRFMSASSVLRGPLTYGKLPAQWSVRVGCQSTQAKVGRPESKETAMP